MVKLHGFTLAELLICLAVLGVIATFTIPKILSAQQNIQYKSVAKEAMGAVAAAYDSYKAQIGVNAYTSPSDFITVLNYVKIQTSGAIDRTYGSTGSFSCTAGSPCYVLANGAILKDPDVKWGGDGTGNYFGGTSTTNYVYFYLDPDGTDADAGTTDGPGKSVQLNIYYNGRVTDAGNCKSGDTTYLEGTGYSNWCPGSSPPWFDWN